MTTTKEILARVFAQRPRGRAGEYQPPRRPRTAARPVGPGACECRRADPIPGRKRCELCLEEIRLYAKLRREQRADEGLCARCSRPATHGAMCDRHRTPSSGRPLGRPPGDPGGLRCTAVAAAYAEGTPVDQIAQVFGVTTKAVYYAIHARGVPLRMGPSSGGEGGTP